ncbi:uncharacterized protein DS421_19g671550 [Arachis hypogaea]|uniref:Uncharacterized protein n=1 Tax=Arachis hypogaea TaxID=3818 RepID=A0A6B9VF38_ARAHY|nr:uncharacterized protein DS421_19g671550 [Arachis hypogaea]
MDLLHVRKQLKPTFHEMEHITGSIHEMAKPSLTQTNWWTLAEPTTKYFYILCSYNKRV